MSYVTELGKRAKDASRVLLTASQDEKVKALEYAAKLLEENSDSIIEANKMDLSAASECGISEVMQDRLRLTTERIYAMADGIREVAALKDPIGEVLYGTVRPNGLRIQKIRVPMGVVGMIYESRPNVTADAFALCFKSGNAVILKGGKEAINSNKAVAGILRQGCMQAGFPADCVLLIEDTSRQVTTELMGMREYLDLLVPRGGAGLIRAVVENAKVPVIETGVGNCHVYIDKGADLEKVRSIVYNSKCSRPSVCNAAESLVIHEDMLKSALPVIYDELARQSVKFHADDRAMKILSGRDNVYAAEQEDYETEYLGYEISVKTVSDIDEAVAHITKYTSGHTECIITESYESANRFTSGVDAAAVIVNASTRFTDGGEFGLGCEIGISTQKLHARGPMGITELTSTKFIVLGDGQIR